MANEHFSEGMAPKYLPESEQADKRTVEDTARDVTGNSLADYRFSVLAASPAWIERALSLPVDLTVQQPLQNPDGTFVPMVGFDD